MAKKIPPLNALRSFEAAARHLSFREAAEELCVSHSAISHQIKLLERYLNIELFIRKARAVELTKAGKQYYPALRSAFEQMSEATEQLLSPQRPDVLTVQLYNTFAIRWMIPRLADFHKQNPGISVRLTMSQRDVDFNHDDVDACIRVGKSASAEVDHRYLFTNELFPVCSPQHRDGLGIKTPNDLSKAVILQVYPSEEDWFTWLNANHADAVNPNNGLQFDSYDHALSAATQGVGVALAMQPFVSRELSAGLLVEVFPGQRVRNPNQWYFVSRREKSRQRKITAFANWLVSALQEDPNIPTLSDDNG